ncbi:molybdate ABC transporter substrate-binding protein [Ruminococcus difficilis]|uniref:Molybdate-binding protein ModA n=1 Tax=Ruminococcus difficilis TaxID=2763069 RepID=A0A934TY68_9FIRM|nr:molybdate ABC transporter substrate-binding protein [Ruminococcus difficilis]MBK6087736.1 molybdate ABC transporter substrate-binding protein [Ruminococcus difficilis]
MKKIFALVLSVLMLTAVLCACNQQQSTKETTIATADERSVEKAEIVVFAAASMTETLESLADTYQATHPEIKITYNFDSSGTLKTQIEEGAVCDLFISAAQKQMNGLEEGGYIDMDTRLDLLENKVALCVAENSKSGIQSYADMKAHLEAGDILMAIGNEDVPVGQYTQKIFNYFGLDENALKEKGVLTYGSNVKEVTTHISEGTVDCGIIYQTDAYSAKLKVADTATEEMCGQVIYPAAVLSKTAHAQEAKAFLTYLQTEEASEVFEGVGFTPLSE